MPTQSENLSKYLCLDYGSGNVGVALANSETRMAFAHSVLKNDKDFLQHLKDLVKQEEISAIVIGIPSYMNKKENEYLGKIIGKIIEKELKIAVFYQDEMFTTKMAHNNLIERGVKGIKRFDDQEAARIILQEWLDVQVQN